MMQKAATMRRSWRLGSACAAVLAALAAGRCGAADLANPGFEVAGQGTPLDGWTLNDKSGATIDRVTTNAHGGAACAAVTVTAAGTPAQLTQTYHVDEFDRYELSAWIRSDKPGLPVTVQIREPKGPQIPLAIRTFAAGAQWQQVTVRGIAPTTCDAIVSISASSPGTFYVDDCTLKALGRDTTNVPAPLTQPVPATYFGMHVHDQLNAPSLTELSPKVMRLWDTHVAWCHLEPKKGEWDFSRFDKIVARWPSDMRLMISLGQTPTWASPHPEDNGHYSPGAQWMPTDIEDWRTYIRTVGQRYRGKITYWEIWNECNWKNFWHDGVPNMVRLTHETHDILKSIDPANVVCTPGFTKDLGEGFINEYFFLGADKDVDAIACHFYPTPSVDHAFIDAMNLRELARSYGLGDKPVFDTESGQKRQVQQVASVAQMNLLYWFAGLQQHDYYSYDNNVYGLTKPAGKDDKGADKFNLAELNDAGEAMVQTRQWMLGASAVSWSIQPDGLHWVQFSRPGGYRCFGIWTTAKMPATFAVPTEWGVTTMRDLTGQRKGVNGSVELKAEPILLETKALP